eukprot:5048511-Pleurochrysis_carterae.AAC.1
MWLCVPGHAKVKQYAPCLVLLKALIRSIPHRRSRTQRRRGPAKLPVPGAAAVAPRTATGHARRLCVHDRCLPR